MARKNYIELPEDPPVSVIGIASNEHIWKLGWSINQALDIDLTVQEGELLSQVSGQLYADYESNPDLEFLLFEPDTRKKRIPRRAKEFRYWFVIRQTRDKAPDLDGVLKKLKNANEIALAFNLTEENLKIFIP